VGFEDREINLYIPLPRFEASVEMHIGSRLVSQRGSAAPKPFAALTGTAPLPRFALVFMALAEGTVPLGALRRNPMTRKRTELLPGGCILKNQAIRHIQNLPPFRSIPTPQGCSTLGRIGPLKNAEKRVSRVKTDGIGRRKNAHLREDHE
jgi:hypothetical protein